VKFLKYFRNISRNISWNISRQNISSNFTSLSRPSLIYGSSTKWIALLKPVSPVSTVHIMFIMTKHTCILKFLTLQTKSYCLTLLANLAYCSSSTLSAIWFNDVSFATLCRANNGSHFVTHDPSSNWPMTGIFERLSATFNETEKNVNYEATHEKQILLMFVLYENERNWKICLNVHL